MTEHEIKFVEIAPPRGIARWCERAQAIDIPGRPELALFPAVLTWHYGDSLAERPYVRSVTYWPDLLSLREIPAAGEYRMTYRSVHDRAGRIVLTATKDGSYLRADRFLRRKMVSVTDGKLADPFFLLLSHLPITEDEKHFVRDWPAEEIAAMRRALTARPGASASGHRPGPGAEPCEEEWGIPKLCREILNSVVRIEGLERSEAAGVLSRAFGMLAAEAAPAD